MSGNGNVVGGWEEIPEALGFRVGSIWLGNTQTLLRDPGGDNVIGGLVGEVMGVNTAGTIAVGMHAGQKLKDAYKWTRAKGVTSLGRYPGQVCYSRLVDRAERSARTARPSPSRSPTTAR